MIEKADIKMVELLMKMYENSVEAIFFFDSAGTVIAMNPAADQILEYDVLYEMSAGKPKSICKSCKGYTSEQYLKTCLNCYLENSDDDFTSFQVYLKTRNRGVIPYSASYYSIDENRQVRLFMLRDLTEQQRVQQELYQNNMMRRIIEAQENERKRISRELHDSVAQELISSLVDLRVLKYMSADEKVLNKVKQTEATLTRLIEDIRNLSVELRPASLDDLGLEAAFRSHFKWVENNYGFTVNFHTELNAARYSNELETIVYRICQEAILNAIKYAEVHEITVSLFEKGDQIHLIVKDQGVGFDVQQGKAQGTGLGLYGIRERAELVNGEVDISSELGKGTTLYLKLPLSDKSSKEINES